MKNKTSEGSRCYRGSGWQTRHIFTTVPPHDLARVPLAGGTLAPQDAVSNLQKMIFFSVECYENKGLGLNQEKNIKMLFLDNSFSCFKMFKYFKGKIFLQF